MRQHLGAVSEIVYVVHAQQTQANVFLGIELRSVSDFEPPFFSSKSGFQTYSIPWELGLVVWRGEGCKETFDPRISGEFEVTGELENTLWRRRIKKLGVVCRVPDTGRTVLWVSGTAWVDKPLLRGGVSPEKRSQTVGLDGFILEQLDDLIRRVSDRGEQSVRAGLGIVLTANVGLSAWPEGADDCGDIGAHLDNVRGRDAVGLVLGVPGLCQRYDLFEALVGGTIDLLGCENERAIGTARCASVLGPTGCIVKAQAHGSTRGVGASA